MLLLGLEGFDPSVSVGTVSTFGVANAAAAGLRAGDVDRDAVGDVGLEEDGVSDRLDHEERELRLLRDPRRPRRKERCRPPGKECAAGWTGLISAPWIECGSAASTNGSGEDSLGSATVPCSSETGDGETTTTVSPAGS